MSQQGKQFLSGLVNRVFHSKKKTNAPSRRLGMEPLEDRQLLAVDPTLLAAANAEAAQTSTLVGPVVEFDLSALTEVKAAAPNFSVSNGTFEETTLVSKPESFQATVGDLVSHATLENGTLSEPAASVYVETQSGESTREESQYSKMGWAATLANMLTDAGWAQIAAKNGDKVVDPDSELSTEEQVFQYFADAFRNGGHMTLEDGLAWFMNGEYAAQTGWAELKKPQEGNLFPTNTGEWSEYSEYCFGERLATIYSPVYNPVSPFKALQERLDSGESVGLEIRFAYNVEAEEEENEEEKENESGETRKNYVDARDADNKNLPKQEWATLWGFETNSTEEVGSPEYYTGINVSTVDGVVRTIKVEWNYDLMAYRLVGTGDEIGAESGQLPYVYSFTSLEHVPVYDVELDIYEKNNDFKDLDATENGKPKADLGRIDQSEVGATGAAGEPLVLEHLSLFSVKPDEATESDPVDWYAFSLGQTASNSDYILLEYQDAYNVAPLKITLYLRNSDGGWSNFEPENGYEPGRYDATFSKETSFVKGDDGKSYATTVCRHRISLAGLNPAGSGDDEFYLKVEFANNVAGQVNGDYKLTFKAGSDDEYEQNDEFEDVADAPLNSKNKPSANLGALYENEVLHDLVLKQYDRNSVSEVDWFRFEMVGEGKEGNEVNLYYQSDFVQENDGDLDFYLYKEDASDSRGYSIVKDANGDLLKSELALKDGQYYETISLEGLEPGVYFVKVVGFKNASNVGYKLEFKPGMSAILDARVENAIVSNKADAMETESVVGDGNDVYFNFDLAISDDNNKDGEKSKTNVKLVLYINGERVADADVVAALKAAQDAGALQISSSVVDETTPYDKLIALFSDGCEMTAAEQLTVSNFFLGTADVDGGSGLAKYFAKGKNAIAVVANPDHYDLGAFYAYVVDDAGDKTFANEAFAFENGEVVTITDGDVEVETTFADAAFIDEQGETVAVVEGQKAYYNVTYKTYRNAEKFVDAEGKTVEFVAGQKIVVDGAEATFKNGKFVDAQGAEIKFEKDQTFAVETTFKTGFFNVEGQAAQFIEGRSYVVDGVKATFKGGKLVDGRNQEIKFTEGQTVVLNSVALTYKSEFVDAQNKAVAFVEGETIALGDVETTYKTAVFVDADGKWVAPSEDATATVQRGKQTIALEKVFGLAVDGGVALDYVAKADANELNLDNNVTAATFELEDMSEDKYAPNASPKEVLDELSHDEDYNPDLGAVNVKAEQYGEKDWGYVVGKGDVAKGEEEYQLCVTGKTEENGAAIADWFKFDLKDAADKKQEQNYANAFLKIHLAPESDDRKWNEAGDLDLYLYKAQLNPGYATFEDASATGAYTLQLVGKSSTLGGTEEISFADCNITEGTYFVRVAGFNGAANRYYLEIGGMTEPNYVSIDNPGNYFKDNDDNNDGVIDASEKAVSILNSVATLNWEIPVDNYVSKVQVRYREKDAEWVFKGGEFVDAEGKAVELVDGQTVEVDGVALTFKDGEFVDAEGAEVQFVDGQTLIVWTEADTFDRTATGCKIAGLEPGTEYVFQLRVRNYFTENNPDKLPEELRACLDAEGWLNAAVVEKTADFLNDVVYRAVIVGVSDYPGSANDLTAAANDAKAFRDALLGDPQWAEGNIKFLANSGATKTAVINALNEFAEKSDDNDVIVFYFAGGGMSGFVGGESVGYLKTYAGVDAQRSDYLSSSELSRALDNFAAGSKLFFLDAGQTTEGVDETSINYKAFRDKLTNSKENGASKRPAQTFVLTAGDNAQVTPIDNVQPRSEFSLALIKAFEQLREVGSEEVEETKWESPFVEDEKQSGEASDGRVAMQELVELIANDETLMKLGALPTVATNVADDAEDVILANGYWSETNAFQNKWVDEKAIVVTTTVDVVDDHDGKISLREAVAKLGTSISTTVNVENGAKFTLGAGSTVTVGTTTGKLSEAVVVEYVDGKFLTTAPCAVDTETKTVEFKKTKIEVVWTVEDWDAGLVSLTDDANVPVEKIERALLATDASETNPAKAQTGVLKEGATLWTAAKKGEALTVVKVGQGYALVDAKGQTRPYRDDSVFYVEWQKGELKEVKLSTGAKIEQNVVLSKVIFDESLAGQALTVAKTESALVIEKGGIIDATALKGELAFDASTGALQISGTELVTLIGVKISGATDSAIIVDEGAKFEIANSLIYNCNSGANAIVSNAGWFSAVNVTVADCASESAIIANTGELKIENSLFALNVGELGVELSDSNLDDGAEDPGFVDAENGDYRLAAFDVAPVDKGSNIATRLECGFVLDVDLAGSDRIGLGGGSVDAGAFEFAPDVENLETPSTIVTTFEDVVNPTDGKISLREAFGYAGTTYEVETELEEGATLTTADGRELEVKYGKLVEFKGVFGTQTGMFHKLDGLFMIVAADDASDVEDAFALADGSKAIKLTTGAEFTLEDGSKAIVWSDGKLHRENGFLVDEGAKITDANGVSGTLSNGVCEEFAVDQRIQVRLNANTVKMVDGKAVPTGLVDQLYEAVYQKDGTFVATITTKTTNASNQEETGTASIAFTLAEGTSFQFMKEVKAPNAETGDDAETGDNTEAGDDAGTGDDAPQTIWVVDEDQPARVIVTEREGKFDEGVYVVAELPTDAEETDLQAGDVLTLQRDVFVDAEGEVVELPKGIKLTSPTGAQVVYNEAEYAAADLEEGDLVKLEDGSELIFKEGLTLYKSVTLGTTITFESGLAAGVVELEKGEITVERAVTLDATTIGGLTIDALGADRVFNVDTYRETSATASAYFAGLTLQNGAAEDGGLIYVAKGSNLKIADSTLKSATATRGGAVFNAGSFSIDANSKQSLIVDVEAEQGGAIYNEGTLSVGKAAIENATANAEGGAIYNVGTANLVGATIQGATAGTDGGAVYNAGVFSATRGATISDSQAQNGAAVYNVGTLAVNNATLSENVATANGGAIYNAGSANLTNAKLFGNNAGIEGGAVYNVGQFLATRSVFAENVGGAVVSTGSATLASSLVLANEGQYALAAFGADASLFLVNVTAIANVGGVYASEGALTIYNSIIGGTVAQDDAALDVKYSMIENAVETLDATNATVYDPAFVKFDENAAWTEWDLKLSAGSAALDAASNEYAFYFDFNGSKVALKVDYNGSGREVGDAVDMGAFEVNANAEVPSTVVTTLDDTFDPYDGKISLREAVKYAALATGSDEASRTVTFSPDLFVFDKSGTIALSNGEAIYEDPFGGTARQDLGAIVLSGSVVITSEYVDEFGETKYYDITIDGRGETQLFVKTGEGDAEFRGFTFANGNASGENKNGGAFEIREGSLSLVDSVVANSYAEKDGGAVYQSGDGVFFAVNAVFYGNEAKRYGGAVAADAGKVYIYNSTIALNDAGIYGGVYSEDGLVTLANSIVAQNGGAQNVDVRAQNLEATTNLIGGMDSWRTVAGLNGNVVGTIFAPADPCFVSTDPASEDFLRLRSVSPAINSGSNVYAFGPDGVRLKFDLNGDERVVGTVVDMGAYESQYLDVPSTVVTTLVDVVDQEDGLISFREALAYAENGSKITFDLGDVTDATLRLEAGEIVLDKSVVIDASNIPGGLTIEGNGDRIFNITDGADVTLENLVLTEGEARDGGAIYMESGKLTAINCVIYGNEATATGGAIYAIGGDVRLLNTTVAGNAAQNFPGVYFGNANGRFELQNSIIAANASETSAAIENYDLHVTGTFAAIASIVGAGTEALQAYDGNGVLVGSPEAFVDAGFVDEASNNYALRSDSPAINKGSNRLIGQAGYYASILLSGSNVRVIATDVNGDERLVGGTVDMGAYEYQIATEVPSVVVTTAQDVVDPFDGLISLREAIDYAGSAYSVDGYVQKVGTEITFAASLGGQTIALAETLDITKRVTIDAVGLKGGLTLDAGGQFVVVKVDATPDSTASKVVLAGLTITGGFADCGAGVYCVGGDVQLLNCVIYGNEATTGAGVRVDAGSVSIVNSTITKNEASNAYGGLYSRGGSVALRNSIVALNTVNGETDGADVYLSGEFTIRATLIGSAASWVAKGYDGVAGNLVGAPNAPVNPSFVDWANNDFALGQNADGFASVALNAGDNSLTAYPNGEVPAYDASGAPRFVGSAVDMGAYESPLGPTEIPSLIVTTAEDVVDPYDGDISLREAVAYANNYGLDRTITFAASINGSTFYLNSELKIGSDLTIDGLANGAVGIVLTTSNDVADQRIINVDTGNVVLNGLTITNRRSERLQAGLDDLSIEEGGAIYVRTGSVSIYNSLITENAAEKGSAVYVNEANSTAYAKLVNCTVVANATNGAKDTAALYAELGSLQLYNTIVALNESTATDVAQDVYQGANAPKVEAYNSFVSRSETLADAISGNGCFIGSSELDLTAETNALFVDADNQDYRLNDDALATNGGNNRHFQEVSSTFNGTFDSFDLDGQRRIYYTTTDMGAFENQAAKDAPFGSVRGKSVTLNVSTGVDVVDPTDGKTSLREALALSDRVQALGYDSVTIRFLDDYSVKVGETAFQVNSPVTILGANATIDCGNANSAFLVETNGAVVIENFEIKNGSALDGGAIKLSSGELTLANVLMNNCEATVYGGALYVAEGAKATLYNVTAAKNVAVDGAGVYGAFGSEVKIYNSIIATNRSATAGVSPTDVYLQGDFKLAYVLVGNAGTAANASKLNGKATSSQIGYGVDREIDPGFIDASGGNFRLSLATSPANGAGSRDYVYGGNSNDLNGEAYGKDHGDWVWIPGEQEGEGGEGGEGENGEFVWVPAPVSMGAYQVSQEAPSTVVTTLEDVVDSRDGLISLREALLYYGRDNVYASGTGSLDGGAYAASNAMNTAYSATFYSPVTFDPSLAGGTIVLDPALGTIQLNYRADTNQVYDYMIDASSIAGLGGITIDGSRLGQRVDDGEDGDDGEGGGDWFRGSTMFQLQGSANTTNGWYWPVHLDLRNVNLVGSGLGTAIEANRFAMVSMRSCLVEGYPTAISVQDDDSADGGIAHIYSSTLLGNVTVGGKAYIYNSIVTGQLNVHDTQNNPGYRTATVYNSYVYRTGGLTGRISKTNVIEGGSVGDLFVDWANGDYRLARYSPAVNRGDNQFLRTLEATHAADEVDLNGNLRVDNGVVDMGCYESQKMVDVPSTTVTTELDVDDPTDGLISIREALAYAVQNVASATLGKTVKFDATLDGKTIVLDGVIELNREVNFDGGTVDITLDAAGKSSIFSIALNADDPVYGNVNDFTISNLTLTGGYTTKNGGAIEISRGNVLLNGVDIYGCSAGGYGGAIYAYDGELTLTDCRIGGNSALYYGGVVNQFGTTVLTGCYVAENSGTTKNSDVWGQYQHNYSHSKNNVIGFVKDITIVDGQYGNRVGTEANPLKPFVSVSTGDLTIKAETAWGAATPTIPPVSSSVLDDAFAAFVDEEDETELAIDLAVLEETVFDDDLFASFEQF